MCGICGVFGQTLERRVLEEMNTTLVRRGPDSEGYFQNDHASLAMRRLSIIDLEAGDQPFRSADGSVAIVFNGEIYNYRELRAELVEGGFSFDSHSDTEVILNLYLRDGEQFPRRLRGMFSIAIWDGRTEIGYLVRDPFGIKPLFYSDSDSGVAFASEIKALVAGGFVEPDIDPVGLDAFFAYGYIPVPHTIYRNVAKLPPGTIAKFEQNKLSQKSYFDLRSIVTSGKRLNERLAESVDDCLQDSVAAHLESDVPVSAFLSGGIDSSLVTSYLAGHESGDDSTVFTIAFSDPGDLADESVLARKLTDKLGIRNKRILVTPDARKILAEAALAFDEPFGDDSIIPTYLISKEVASRYKVALTGLGGDEFFGGYSRYEGMALHQEVRKLGPWLPKILAWMAGHIPGVGRAATRLRRFADAVPLPPDKAYLSMVSALSSGDRTQIYSDEFASEVDQAVTEALILEPFNELEEADSATRAMYTDMRTYLPEDILALSDRIAMWHSLELRVPFVDPKVATMSQMVPIEKKVSLRRSKPILRELIGRLVPEIANGKKQGFQSPVGQWARGEFGTWASGLIDEYFRLNSDASLNKAAILRILDQHMSGVEDHRKLLFRIVMYVLWRRECFESVWIGRARR